MKNLSRYQYLLRTLNLDIKKTESFPMSALNFLVLIMSMYAVLLVV